MFPPHDSILGCPCLASSKRLGAYPTQSKTVLDPGDLGLRDGQSLGAFLVFRAVRVDDLPGPADHPHPQPAARALPSVLQAPPAASLRLPLPPPPQSPVALTPQGPELCYVEKHLAALLVYYP